MGVTDTETNVAVETVRSVLPEAAPKLAVTETVPVIDPFGQTLAAGSAAHGSDGRVARTPRDNRGEILGRAVGVGTGGSKLLGGPLRDGRIGGGNCDGIDVAAVISNVVCAVAAPNTTLMFVVPTATLVASPWLPAVLLIVANAVLLDVQVASVVTSCVELSEKVAMATNELHGPFGNAGERRG